MSNAGVRNTLRKVNVITPPSLYTLTRMMTHKVKVTETAQKRPPLHIVQRGNEDIPCVPQRACEWSDGRDLRAAALHGKQLQASPARTRPALTANARSAAESGGKGGTNGSTRSAIQSRTLIGS